MIYATCIMIPGQPPYWHGADLPVDKEDERCPEFKPLWDFLQSIMGGASIMPEHVTVLYQERRTDMFVDDKGLYKDLPRNEVATTIYRASHLRKYPTCPPENLSYVAGPAVLFPIRIWY